MLLPEHKCVLLGTRNSLKNNQCICKAGCVETILRQRSIKDQTAGRNGFVEREEEEDLETYFTRLHGLELLLAPP